MKKWYAVIHLVGVALFFCFLLYPWSETSASKQSPSQIPPAAPNQEPPNQQLPCVCKSLKISHGSVTPSVKVERDKKAEVKTTVKKTGKKQN